jgi:HEAT repeat protein
MTSAYHDLAVDELWERALACIGDEEGSVSYLVELHRRGSREIFERAVASCSSADVNERMLAVRILRELGGSPPRFRVEAVPHLLAVLAVEPDPAARRWIISAIGYQHMSGHNVPRLSPTKEVLSVVLSCASDDDLRVRFAVAAALHCLVDLDAPEPEAIETLIRLSADSDADTRWYALSALVDDFGCTGDDVRAAVQRRVDDPDPGTRQAARRVLDGGKWGS